MTRVQISIRKLTPFKISERVNRTMNKVDFPIGTSKNNKSDSIKTAIAIT